MTGAYSSSSSPRRRGSRSSWFGVWFAAVGVLALSVATCGKPTNQDTGVVVQLFSELKAPNEIDGIRIQASGIVGVQERVALDRVYTLAQGPDSISLPSGLLLVPTSKGDGRIRVIVTGLRGNAPVVRRSAVVSFVPGRVLTLPLVLRKTCVGILACDPGNGLTCKDDGRCGSNDVDNAALIPFASGSNIPMLPPPDLTDSGTQLQDAGTKDAGGPAGSGGGAGMISTGGMSGMAGKTGGTSGAHTAIIAVGEDGTRAISVSGGRIWASRIEQAGITFNSVACCDGTCVAVGTDSANVSYYSQVLLNGTGGIDGTVNKLGISASFREVACVEGVTTLIDQRWLALSDGPGGSGVWVGDPVTGVGAWRNKLDGAPQARRLVAGAGTFWLLGNDNKIWRAERSGGTLVWRPSATTWPDDTQLVGNREALVALSENGDAVFTSGDDPADYSRKTGRKVIAASMSRLGSGTPHITTIDSSFMVRSTVVSLPNSFVDVSNYTLASQAQTPPFVMAEDYPSVVVAQSRPTGTIVVGDQMSKGWINATDHLPRKRVLDMAVSQIQLSRCPENLRESPNIPCQGGSLCELSMLRTYCFCNEQLVWKCP